MLQQNTVAIRVVIELGNFRQQFLSGRLLTQFDGNYALALAAYNAGPNKVKKWLPDDTLPADIWIETIPYRETREYVTSVLAYALIYQQRMQSNGLSMGLLTGEVQPLALNP